MDGLDLLWVVYAWYPTAVVLDFIAFQFSLRWSYRKANKRLKQQRG